MPTRKPLRRTCAWFRRRARLRVELRRLRRFRWLALADRASGGRSAGVGWVGICAGVLVEKLRMVFSGHQQEPSPPLVRYDALRESGESAEVLRAEEKQPLASSNRNPVCNGLGLHRRVRMFAKPNRTFALVEWGTRSTGAFHKRTSRIRNAPSEGVFYGHDYCEWSPARGAGAGRHSAALCVAQRSAVDWPAVRVRPGAVRSLCRTGGRERDAVLRYAGGERWRPGDHHAGRFAGEVGQAKRPVGGGSEKHAAPGAAGVDRRANSAVRILPERDDDQGDGTARKQSASDPGAD